MRQVDRLEFIVLVDNVIEWFSVLPPGFSHELPQHLSRPPPHECRKDPLTGLPELPLDNACCGAHGLSILIRTTVDGRTSSVLMDAGPEELSIERNAKAMAIDLTELDALVLSHWHRDHSGGILKTLALRSAASPVPLPPLRIDLHPVRPIRRGIAPPPDFIPKIALPPDPTFDEISHANGYVDLHDEFHEIPASGARGTGGTGVYVSGEIPRVEGFERGVIGGVTWMEDEDGQGGWFSDPLIKDERYVVVDVKGHGLVVFSSCSHAGICNVLTSAQTSLSRPIHMIVGGLHLVPTHIQPARETVDFIARRIKPRPKYVLPLHCTGLEARGMLRNALDEGCIPAGVGMRVVADGDPAKEGELERLTLEIIT